MATLGSLHTESAPLHGEAYQGNPDPAALITETAARVGIELESNRLAVLIDVANMIDEAAKAGYRKGSPYNYDQFQATRALPQDGVLVSDIHFQPHTSEVPSARTAQPKEATRIAHQSIWNLQNYMFLVDARIIDRPDLLLSETNPQMAKAAQRLGFSAEQGEQGKIMLSAPFEVIHDAVFSPETLAFDAMLTRRLESTYQGQTPPAPQY